MVTTGATVTTETETDLVVCDFCADDDPFWAYECPDIPGEGDWSGTSGDWLACSKCSRLIEDKDAMALLIRAINGIGLRTAVEIEESQIMHERFLDAMTGKRKSFIKRRIITH